MKQEPLTTEHFDEFQKHWNSMGKKATINELWNMFMYCQELQQKVEALKEQASRHNTDYLSRCRSVGGVTLPPGV